MARLNWYVLNLLISLDQLGAALLGGFCDETLSSYAYRMRLQQKPAGFFADWIDSGAKRLFRQDDHCHGAYLRIRARIDLPPELR
jgi:hypothetical protein